MKMLLLQNKSLLRIIASTAVVVIAAVLCRWIVLTTDNEFVEQLANLVRIFLYLGLFAAWGISVSRRVMQIQVRRYLMAVAVLMVLWLTVREYRWHLVFSEDMRRWLWYAYYIPILLIPLIAFFVSLSLGKSEAYRVPRWTVFLSLPTFALIGLVLTNDLHQWMFIFPANAVMQTELDYRYGILFYILSAWGVLCTLAALTVMFKKCRIPHHGKLLRLPLLPFAVAVGYIILYALRVPFVVNALGDLAVFDCLVFTAFFESCIQCGLIQSNTHYSDLFGASVDLSAQITDKDYNVRYTARDAEPISQADMIRAETAPIILPEGKRLHNMEIRGGHAIWTEDISELLDLREALEDARAELKERNDFLQLEYEQEKEYRRVMEQNRLYDLLQAKTQSQLNQVGRLAANYEAADSPEEKRRILTRIAVLGSYIKRRKDFVLLLEGANAIPENRLTSALDESFRSLALGGVRGVFLVETGRDTLPGNTMTLAYDFFEQVIETVLDRVRYVTVHVNDRSGALRCSILTDCAADTAALSRSYPNMRVVRDEDGGVEYILPLTGGVNP